MAAKGKRETSAPFQSVKDAVMLFGPAAWSNSVKRPKAESDERVLTMKTKIGLAQKELSKLKEKIKTVETTKTEALLELEKAKIMIDDLSEKVRAADGPRDSDTRATEIIGNQGNQNKRTDSTQKQDLESAVDIYTNVLSKLDQKKQEELWKICQNMRNVEGIDLDSVIVVTSNLDVAKESLQRVAEEENGLCKMLESLKNDLKNVQKEHAELIEKERETEAIARDLHAQLQKSKTDLEISLAERSKASEALGAEAGELRKEAEDVKIELRELEGELKATLLQAEAAKAAKERALECANGFAWSERTNTAETSFSESVSRITTSREKYEPLLKKAEEFNNLADIKVKAALVQVRATGVCTDEALKTLEMCQREIKDLQAGRKEALKKAETAEGAKKAVEAEHKRRREGDQKKANAFATRILAETEIPVKSSPHHSETLKRNSGEKLQKPKTQASKKVLLPNVSGIFQRRKNQDEARFASCLPS